MAKLYFRYGAMNSGKTTALLQVAFNYKERGMRVLILKASIDTKGGDRVVSRLGVSCPVDALVPPETDILQLVEADIAANARPVCCVMRASCLRQPRPSSCFWSRWIWGFRSFATGCGPIS